MSSSKRVACGKRACTVTWPRDPALEVPCPECNAPIGVRCKRPSGHRVFGGEPHDARDITADKAGHYGPCPSQRCGLSTRPDRLRSGTLRKTGGSK